MDLEFSADTDSSTIGYKYSSVIPRISNVGEPLVGSRRFLIEISRVFHVQGLMRSFKVEALFKRIKSFLLLKVIAPCWFCRLKFESPMHSLMATILLRIAWFNSLQPNAQTDPPD